MTRACSSSLRQLDRQQPADHRPARGHRSTTAPLPAQRNPHSRWWCCEGGHARRRSSAWRYSPIGARWPRSGTALWVGDGARGGASAGHAAHEPAGLDRDAPHAAQRRRRVWPITCAPTPSGWTGWLSDSSGSATRPRREPIGLGALADRVARLFPAAAAAARQPDRPASGGRRAPGPTVQGDPVLLEWALEALVKNAIDALQGRGGRSSRSRAEVDGDRGELRVIDDGPGVAARVPAHDRSSPGSARRKAAGASGWPSRAASCEDAHGGRAGCWSHRGGIPCFVDPHSAGRQRGA